MRQIRCRRLTAHTARTIGGVGCKRIGRLDHCLVGDKRGQRQRRRRCRYGGRLRWLLVWLLLAHLLTVVRLLLIVLIAQCGRRIEVSVGQWWRREAGRSRGRTCRWHRLEIVGIIVHGAWYGHEWRCGRLRMLMVVLLLLLLLRWYGRFRCDITRSWMIAYRFVRWSNGQIWRRRLRRRLGQTWSPKICFVKRKKKVKVWGLFLGGT